MANTTLALILLIQILRKFPQENFVICHDMVIPVFTLGNYLLNFLEWLQMYLDRLVKRLSKT